MITIIKQTISFIALWQIIDFLFYLL